MPGKIRWALIGCGDIAEKATAPAINADPNSVLHAVVRRSREKVQDFAARHKSRTFHCQIEDALRDPEVDAVYVATPVALHKEQTIAACNAGKHVLCEKPMAMNAAECADMVRAARANGVTLGVSYYRRLYPKVVRVKELLAQGVIGKPQVVRIDLRGWYAPAPDDPKRWRISKAESGGGVLMDVGSHRLDIICYLLGEPQRVCGLTDRLVMKYDVPDTETLLCRMQSGVHVECSCYWNMPFGADEMEVHGTEGALIATPFDGDVLRVRTKNGEEEIATPKADNVHLPLIASFAARVGSGQPPEFDGTDGLQATRIIDGCYRSAASGSWIEDL